MNPDDSQNEQPQQGTMPQPPTGNEQTGAVSGAPEGEAPKTEGQGEMPSAPESGTPGSDTQGGAGDASSPAIPGSEDEQDGSKW